MSEFYKTYRPKTLKSLVGQKGAVASLKKLIEGERIPHAILLTGPSGCGKTTIARILKFHLDCGDNDFFEINCADFKGIDMVRDIRRHCNLAPMHGSARIWLIDEAHKLTGDAQAAFLKILEDTPSGTYFILATTDPQKLTRTIHTRCTEIKLNVLSEDELRTVILRVVEKENLAVGDKTIEEIVEASEGSARKALVILQQVGLLETEEEQIAAVQTTSANKDLAISLARELIKPKASWQAVASILKGLTDDPEKVRYLVLGYCRSVMLGGGPLAFRAFQIIDVFSDNFYDSKQAGLAAACWEVTH